MVLFPGCCCWRSTLNQHSEILRLKMFVVQVNTSATNCLGNEWRVDWNMDVFALIVSACHSNWPRRDMSFPALERDAEICSVDI